MSALGAYPTVERSCPSCGGETEEIRLDALPALRCTHCGSAWRDAGHTAGVSRLEHTWSDRLNAAVLALGDAGCRSLRERLQRDGVERGVWIEHAGERCGITLALRPRLMDLACRGYLHHVAWQVRMGLRRVVRLTASEPMAAAVMPLEPGEQEWIARYRLLDARFASPHGERLFCRLDALGSLEGPGWRERLKFIEANVVGIGGMSYTPPAEQLMMEHVIEAIVGPDSGMEFDVNRDPRLLLMDELADHARALGNAHSPVVAFVDDCSLYTLGGELGRLVPWFRTQGLDAVYCDVRELEVAGDGRVTVAGRALDVVYRFVEIRDLVDMEARGEDLSGMKAAFAAGRVVPSAGGDLEHKSCFELLTDPLFAGAFEPELRAVARDHVLWTRLLRERTTTGPDGEVVDLTGYVGARRASLVIKPNRAAGGEGVVLGALVDDGAWHDTMEHALAVPDSHVVQQAAHLDVEPFPVLDESGHAALAPRYCAMGLFPARRGLSVFGRYSSSGVVNIQSGGGIAPFLVSVR